MGVDEKIASVVIDSLSIEDLEEILRRKKCNGKPPKPKPMSEKQKLVHYYTNLLIKSRKVYAPKNYKI